MAATRKRKPIRTPTKSKKAKTEEADEQQSGERLPTNDVQAAAAEVLKAVRKSGEVVEALVNGSASAGHLSPANQCANGDCCAETELSINDVADNDVDSSHEAIAGENCDVTGTQEKQTHSKETPTGTSNPLKPCVGEVEGLDVKAQIDCHVTSPGSRVTPHTQFSVCAQTPYAPPPVPAAAAEETIEEKGEVSSLYVGRVIGKGGEMIRDLQARSGCRIDVDQNVPHGAPRIITYRGTRSTIDFAIQLVTLLCTDKGKDADLPLGQAVMKKVQVPGNVVGKIIGKGGEMIRKMQNESQAKIQVDHSGAGMVSNYRQVTITGTNDSVVKAQEMIMFLCANRAVDSTQALQMLVQDKTHSGGLRSNGPPYLCYSNRGQVLHSGVHGNGGKMNHGSCDRQQTCGNRCSSLGVDAMGITESDVFPCAKMYMGRVIGQKGVTINDLQRRSGCDIQINQNVPVGQNCQITIKGSRQGIEMVKQMLQEIIDLGPNHPYAGGHGNLFGRIHHADRHAHQHASYPNSSSAIQGYHHTGYSHEQYGMSQQQHVSQTQYQQQQSYQPQQVQHYGTQPYANVFHPQASPWRAAVAADGQIYYYNEITQETQWERPE